MRALILITLAAALVIPAQAQETPSSLVASYDSLADTILSVRQMEENFIRAVLEGHLHGAKARAKQGDYDGAAAEMALFANEGDNAMGGVRKRLVEGGHHHHATDEQEEVYDPGFVVVTREAKKKVLAAAAALRQAGDDDARKAAWEDFATVAKELLKK